jgi:hypothetical protein
MNTQVAFKKFSMKLKELEFTKIPMQDFGSEVQQTIKFTLIVKPSQAQLY